MLAIEVKNLVKAYNGTEVVKGINLSVSKGSVFGFLGPNGAGKTTTLEMIEGLRKPSQGEIYINGLNTATEIENIKAIIGIGVEWKKIKAEIKTTRIKFIEGCKNMEEIVKTASEIARDGDVVLLTPACSSFDMFKNYKVRGQQFKTEVRNLIQ